MTSDPFAPLDLGDELAWEPMRIVPPDPWTGHLAFAFWLVKAIRPAALVELGTHSGNSYFAFCQAMATLTPAGRAYAVDTWQGDEHSGGYDEDVWTAVHGFNAQHFRGFSTLLRTTFDNARGYFADASVDLLHIDGMHSYDAVRHDFETWAPTLSTRGVIVFHDVNVRERNFGVWRFWDELRTRHPSFTFDHSNGLGIAGIGAEQSPAMRALFSLSDDPDASGALRRRFAARGEAFQRQVEILSLRERLAQAEVDAQRSRQDFGRQSAELAWRDALMATQRDLVRAKEASIAALGNVLAGRAQSIAVRDRLIEARDTMASELMADLRHEKFLTGEERRVRGEMQQGYEAAIARIDADRDVLRHSAEAIQRQSAQDAAELQRATAAHVAQMYVGSTSWKLTRPLRVATRLLRGRRAAPGPIGLPPLAPPPEVSQVATIADDVPAAAATDVTAPSTLKQVMRGVMASRLQAFLGGSAMLRLPRAETPDISIVLVLYNQAELTYACLASIIETAGDTPVEVVIADNASTDDTAALLGRTLGATIVRNSSNLHFLRAANLAAKSARGRTILLLNNDAQLMPGALASALRVLDGDPTVGAVGGRIILPDGTLQEAGSIIWNDGACSGYARGDDPAGPDVMFQRDVDYCSGAFLLTGRALWQEMGGFDERYAPAYYEETDYCVRLWQRGRRVVYDPGATILHYEFGSSTRSGEALRLQAANHAVFTSQHKRWLAGQFPPSPRHVLAARMRGDAPRVLVLEDRVPKLELGTGYPRSNRLVHELVAAGAAVTFFPMFRHYETWSSVRRALDQRIEVLMRAEAPQLRDYLIARPQQFDAVLVCRPQNMRALLEAIGPERGLLGGAALLYDAEALFVTRELQRRAADGDPAPELDRHVMVADEVSLTRMADAVISVSPAEQAVLEDYGAQNVHLLGHALEDTPLPSGFHQRDQVLFLGAMGDDAAPNADAVRWFATSILPRLRQVLDMPALRLTVVGRVDAPSVRAMDGDTLDLVGMVDDLPPALARARVMAVPTRFAAGIPHKVHQAAMLGIPMVVTGLIAEQLGWRDGEELLVADTAGGFADACAQLYTDAALWQRLRARALARARQDCDPAQFTRKVREIVSGLKIVHRRPEPPAGTRQVEAPQALQDPPATSRPADLDRSVAVPFGFAPLDRAVSIGVVCHLFHPEVGPEVLFYLRHLPGQADLFVSTDTEAKRVELAGIFAAWDRGAVQLRVMPNRGRDIAPKLVGFAEAHDRYDLVLHLHSKMSTHAAFLQPWRSYLFETLLGSPEVVRSNLDAFARLPDLGMVAPQHFEAIRRWLGWNGNFDAAEGLAARMGVTLSPRRALDFPSGSMFWARPAALRPLLGLGLGFEDFPDESAQQDHTPAHAIERLFFYSCEASGHTWLKVAQPALMHDTSTVTEVATPAALSRFVAEHGIMLSGPGPIAVESAAAPMRTRTAPGLAMRLAERAL